MSFWVVCLGIMFSVSDSQPHYSVGLLYHRAGLAVQSFCYFMSKNIMFFIMVYHNKCVVENWGFMCYTLLKLKTNLQIERVNMDEKNNVTEQLKELITIYGFNKNTLSQYLGLPLDSIEDLSNGNIDFLPDDCSYRFRLFNKISFLYASATEDKDLKLTAFLQVLLSHHGLSKKTVAAMAGVETKDIERLLSNPPKKVSEEIKFKIAVTVMSLRFFLKDCEPQT